MTHIISVVMPCLNEADTLSSCLRKAQAGLTEAGVEAEIIVADNGSTDGSQQIAEKFGARVIPVPTKGYGAALMGGIAASRGQYILMGDADLEYDPSEYPILLQHLLENRADVVFGSRFMGGRPHRVLYFWHSVGNTVLTLLSNMFTNLNITDMETCYKAFRREIIQSIRIEENRFGFEPEITAKVARLGVRIFEVGISYYGRTYAEGKKIGWKDGVRALWVIVKFAFVPRR